MGGSAHAGEKVQERASVAFDQRPESVFVAVAHPRHQGEVVGFGLDGFAHGEAFLDQLPEKEKSFAEDRSAAAGAGKIAVNLRRPVGAGMEMDRSRSGGTKP